MRGLDDAATAATLDLVGAIAAAYPTLGQVALSDLHDQQVEAHRVWALHFASYLAGKGITEDLPSPLWPICTAPAALPA